MTVPFTFMGRTSAEPTILRVGAKIVIISIGCISNRPLIDEWAYFIDINMSIHLDMSIHFRNFAVDKLMFNPKISNYETSNERDAAGVH